MIIGHVNLISLALVWRAGETEYLPIARLKSQEMLQGAGILSFCSIIVSCLKKAISFGSNFVSYADHLHIHDLLRGGLVFVIIILLFVLSLTVVIVNMLPCLFLFLGLTCRCRKGMVTMSIGGQFSRYEISYLLELASSSGN